MIPDIPLQDLTAKQIFERLVSSGSITLPNSEEAEKLFRYLLVIKSRNKKLYEELGLNFNNFLIKRTIIEGTMTLVHENIKAKKRYAVFKIEEPTEPTRIGIEIANVNTQK